MAFWLPSAVAVALSGCGGSASPLKTGGPHQGVLIKLPESKGYAELVVEPLAKPVPRRASNELALYFLGPDMVSPMTALPSEVTLAVIDPESRQKTPRKLTSSPKAGDPTGSARFATGPTDVEYGSFSIGGELQVDLGGPIRVPF